MQAVKYIGRKPFSDRIYGSKLTFEPEQTRTVPADLARKFLRHVDVFVPGEAAKAKKAAATDDTAELLEQAAMEQAEARDQQESLQDLRDQVSYMDKEALDLFARTNYRQELDKRRSLPALREQVVGFIDQFGAV